MGIVMIIVSGIGWFNNHGDFYKLLGAIGFFISALLGYLEYKNKANTKATIQAGDRAKIAHVQGHHNKINIQ